MCKLYQMLANMRLANVKLANMGLNAKHIYLFIFIVWNVAASVHFRNSSVEMTIDVREFHLLLSFIASFSHILAEIVAPFQCLLNP